MSRWYENWIKFMCTAHNWIISFAALMCCCCCCCVWAVFMLSSVKFLLVVDRFSWSVSLSVFLCHFHSWLCIYLHLIRFPLHCIADFLRRATRFVSFIVDCCMSCCSLWVGLMSDLVRHEINFESQLNCNKIGQFWMVCGHQLNENRIFI